METPSYDARGNLTAAGGPAYRYTSRNRLWEASGVTVLNADSLDRLDYVSAEGVLLAHDGANLVSEVNYNGSVGAIARRYVFGPGVDEPLVWYEGAGTNDRRYLHADERGSIVAVTDNGGTALAINSYDEHGIPGGNVGRFQYTGQIWLASLGMYDYKARTYSPTLGRFLQTDPIGYQAGLNWYAYAGSDPVNATDPTGLTSNEVVITGMSWSQITAFLHQAISLTGIARNQNGDIFAPEKTEAAKREESKEIVVRARRKMALLLDRLAENYLKPPPGRQEGESFSDCMARLTSPANAGMGAAAVELGRANKALYPRGAPAGASGTSYISTTTRKIEKALGGGGVGSRGNYWFGAKTIGGAIGRGLSMLSAMAGSAVAGFEGGKAVGAVQICQ